MHTYLLRPSLHPTLLSLVYSDCGLSGAHSHSHRGGWSCGVQVGKTLTLIVLIVIIVIVFILTRRYGLLRGPTSSFCSALFLYIFLLLHVQVSFCVQQYQKEQKKDFFLIIKKIYLKKTKTKRNIKYYIFRRRRKILHFLDLSKQEVSSPLSVTHVPRHYHCHCQHCQ